MADNGENEDRKPGFVALLRASGGLFTAIAIAVVGFITNSSLERMKASETRAQLYAELMSKREDADSALRKDMFVSIIQSFIDPSAASLDKNVLNLELLAYNFHEALNLKPLFVHIAKQVQTTKDPSKADYQERLERVAHEVSQKQIMVLGGAGRAFDRVIDLESLRASQGAGIALAEETLEVNGIKRIFRIRVMEENPETRELRVLLTVATPRGENQEETNVSEFWVGAFDFPMIDNVRLLPDQRAAMVLNRYDQSSAYITLIYFPGSYAGLKEKPYFQEVMKQLLNSQSDGQAI
ncbi:MAG: hypothetical protein IDH49_10600 [Gammaproteobacteria bacterium]|nr:hypothetical protein [Gammaproteobacteria bacterium]